MNGEVDKGTGMRKGIEKERNGGYRRVPKDDSEREQEKCKVNKG